MNLILTVLVNAVALLASTYVVDGIDVTEATWPAKVGTLLVVAAIFGLVNTIVKPIVKLIGCGIYVLTLGLFGLVVNALLFLLVGWFAEQFGLSFEVDGFWAGFWGAIVVWIVSFVLNLALDLSKDKD
ncbi:phage holin family protein [Cryptosporangium aurantiacum]|uniref:Putative membrane protein n=1 Tax=Cryptosporangium aurantiacum TaxID=134849 RepID=A0A1M7IJC6_9ACTN|nr:phage holin family protein [Cryptosporangium aurantiacum]SHM40708.1 putative membrane protein [Cryptosporangium aurantiacum]